jgi:hypothetical protein
MHNPEGVAENHPKKPITVSAKVCFTLSGFGSLQFHYHNNFNHSGFVGNNDNPILPITWVKNSQLRRGARIIEKPDSGRRTPKG